MLALLWLTIFGQWTIHTYWLILMVVDTKFMEQKQNKPKLSSRHLYFSKKINKKIHELKELY